MPGTFGAVSLQFFGSGDAFGSGGRFQTCFRVWGAGTSFLIDCGASSLVAMSRAGFDPLAIDWVLVSHLHGDHFGGLPFLILDAQFRRRTRPLGIVGPPGIRERLRATMEALFPGSSETARRFALEILELAPSTPTRVGEALVTGYPVAHMSGAPSYGLRLEYGGKIVAYSGDTEWTETLRPLSRGADLFVCEAYFFDRKVKYHLDYQTLRAQVASLDCRRVVITHMSAELLSRLAEIDLEYAEDGKVVAL